MSEQGFGPDPALVPTASSQQAVSTKGFDPGYGCTHCGHPDTPWVMGDQRACDACVSESWRRAMAALSDTGE